MSFKLPDFASVGFDDPRAAGGLPNFPANDPGSEGLATFGKGVQAAGGALEDLAAEQQRKKDKLEEAMATADLAGNYIRTTEQIKTETDPAKLTELRASLAGFRDQAAGAISNPYRQKLWSATHSKTVAEGQALADLRQSHLYQDRYAAGIDAQAMSLAGAGATASDPQAFDVSLGGIKDLYSNAQNVGAKTAEQALHGSRAAQKQLIGGRVQHLVNTGQLDAATSLLDQHQGDFLPLEVEHYRGVIENKDSSVRSFGGALRSLGMAPAIPGTSGPRGEEGTTPGHLNYGGTGALGNPSEPGWQDKNLTSITAPSGASFRVNKAAAEDFTGFLNDLETAGYKIDPEQSGGHAHRNMKGGSSLSEHAYGAAIDINWNQNLYSKEGKKVTDLPGNVSEIAAKHNIEWGGNWRDPVDTMHFQWIGPRNAQTAAAGAPDAVNNWETQNNNFGGLRKPGVHATTAEGGFQSFATPEAGVQAIADRLDQYAAGGVTTEMNPDGKPLNTIRGIVSVWAPPTENDTPMMIARAAKIMGVPPDQPLDLSNPSVKAKLIEATIRNEQAGKLPVNPAIITKVASGASNAAPAGKPVAIGDSIAAHLIRKAGVGGVEYNAERKPDSTAVAGFSPSDVLGIIKSTPAENIQGRDVLLSTGMSNNPEQVEWVADQIKTLKARGAASVTVLGVGTAARVKGANDQLSQIAADNGAAFAGPMRKVAGDGIHSSDPKDLLAQAQAVRPIPTGAEAAPATAPAAAPAAPPNRTGLPMPDEIMRRIQADPSLRNDKERAQAFAHAESIYRTQEAALAQRERIATQAQQQQLRDAENEIFADVYGAAPKVTPQMIAVDPRFNGNPERRKQMIELVNNPPGTGVPAAQSQAAALALVDRIRLPDGDPNKITDVGQIYDSLHSLNRADFEFAKKEFDAIRTPGGEMFAKRKADFIKRATPSITKSNPLMGTPDPEGDAQLYNLEWLLDQKIDEYRKAGKNPVDLLDPSKPDFIGSQKSLAPFQTSMQDSVKQKTKAVTGGVPSWPTYPPAAPTPTPTPPASAVTEPRPTIVSPTPGTTAIPGGIRIPIPPVPLSALPPRNAGETPGQYLNRIGAGVPAPPAAAAP